MSITESIKTTITGRQVGRDKKDIMINITITEDIRTSILCTHTRAVQMAEWYGSLLSERFSIVEVERSFLRPLATVLGLFFQAKCEIKCTHLEIWLEKKDSG